MTYDELLERIYQIHNDSSDGGKPITKQYSGMLKFQKALRAVVELHQPVEKTIEEVTYLFCAKCTDLANREMNYPCEDVQAIEKELG